MKERVLQWIRGQNLLSATDRVLVAMSGGRDSVCLAHLLQTSGYQIALAHVNYGLRGIDSDADEQFVLSLGAGWGIKTHVKHVDPVVFEEGPVQEKARRIRYEFFETLCTGHGYTHIATAHHADDRMETLFINLLRGTGIHGLKGIPASRGNILRPLIHTSREEIEAYIKEHGLLYRDDASNATDKYERNRIRHKLIPLLKEIDPDALQKLQRSMANLEEDARAMENAATALREETGDGHVVNLKLLPEASKDTWCYHALYPFGFNRDQAADITQAAGSGKYIANAGYTAVRKGDMVIVRPNVPRPTEALVIPQAGEYTFGNKAIRVASRSLGKEKIPRDKKHIWLDASRVHFPLTLRHWQAGDRFQPLGCDYQVKVSDYLTDKKVDRINKQDTLLLCDATAKVLWVVHHEIADFAKVDDTTTLVYSITIPSV